MPVTFQDIFKTSFLEKAAAVPSAGHGRRPGAFLSAGAVCVLHLQAVLRWGDVLPQLRGDAGGPVPHHHPAHFNGGEQHRPVVGHGGGLVHRPVPHPPSKSPWTSLSCSGAIAAGIVLAAGLVFLAVGGQPVHRGGALRFLQAQVAGDPPTSSWSTAKAARRRTEPKSSSPPG